ncbi:MAG: ester cyclase [Anaerolineae bacterium]|nr:ester cyclase [Anaerolineae bacterium]
MITGPMDCIRLLIDRGWNEGNVFIVEQVYSPHCIRYDVTTGVAESLGLEAHKNEIRELRAAFPDLRVTLEEMIGAGHKVVCRLTFAGTQQGEWLGVAPTGRYANWGAIAIYRFVANKIQECWMAQDLYGALKQLRAVSLNRKAA